MRRPPPDRSAFLVLSVGAILTATGCSGRAASASSTTATNDAGSLTGTWKSPTPLSMFRNVGSPPVWLGLRFSSGGKGVLHYAPTIEPYIANVGPRSRTNILKRTIDAGFAYEVLDEKRVRLVFGDTALIFNYEFSGSRLLLTQTVGDGGDGVTHVYEQG